MDHLKCKSHYCSHYSAPLLLLIGTPGTMSRIKWTLNLCDYKEYYLHCYWCKRSHQLSIELYSNGKLIRNPATTCYRTQMNPRLKVNFYKPYLLIRGGPPDIITLCWSCHSTALCSRCYQWRSKLEVAMIKAITGKIIKSCYMGKNSGSNRRVCTTFSSM